MEGHDGWGVSKLIGIVHTVAVMVVNRCSAWFCMVEERAADRG